MIQVGDTILEKVKAHAKRTYPEECCGILIGMEDADRKTVSDVLEIDNAKKENRARRFLITPGEYRRAEETARGKGLAVLGFYHSHPDHPARPSQFDVDHAMPWCSYMIVSVNKGLPGDVTSWVLQEDHRAFSEEHVDVPTGNMIAQSKPSPT